MRLLPEHLFQGPAASGNLLSIFLQESNLKPPHTQEENVSSVAATKTVE
jgi:hypothetical protein